MSKFDGASIVATATVLMFVSTAGQAQIASADQSPATSKLDEIVVTAQKRSESINSVGMSITAAGAAMLQEKRIVGVEDLTRVEPSLQFAESPQGTPVYTIRGVGYYEQSLAASPTISIYQDEIAFPFPVMSKGVLLDPERVEILKGPQGTLYGQNATGGAINFIAAKPTKAFDAGVDYSYGRFNDNLVSGYVSGPLTSTVSARLSGSLEQGGAWQESATRDDKLGTKRNRIGRLIVDWKPSDRFSARININGWTDHSDTQAGQLEGIRFSSPQYISPNALTPPAANFLPSEEYFPNYPDPIKALVQSPVGTHDDRDADWQAGTHPRNREGFYQVALRLDYNFSNAFAITSLTSYEHFKEHNVVDQGGVGVPVAQVKVDGTVKAISEEIRLHGEFGNGKAHWLAGVNYESDKSSETDFQDPYVTDASYLTGGSPFSAVQIAPFQFGAYNKVGAETKAAFANADYKLIDSVTLHGGLRYTEVDQAIATCSTASPSLTTYLNAVAQQLAAAFGGPAPTPTEPYQCVTLGPPPTFQPGITRTQFNQHNVSWRVGIDWVPFERGLLYFNVSKGYKAGSSPALGATTYTQLTPVNQESVIAYEAGAKLSLFDRSLQLNGAYFHYDYTDKQFLGRVHDPLGIFGAVTTLVNIPKSAVDGVELSASWRPVAGVTITAAGTYLNSRVTTDYFNYSTYVIGDGDTVNFRGEAFPYTPKWSVQGGGRYDWRLNDAFNAFVSTDASYQSKTTSSFGAAHAATEGPSVVNKSYAILNLTAGIETADKRWRVEVFGKNVTNTYYWNTASWTNDSTIRLTGMPATYGVSLHWRFR